MPNIDELRQNMVDAWEMYFQVCDEVEYRDPDATARITHFHECAILATEQFEAAGGEYPHLTIDDPAEALRMKNRVCSDCWSEIVVIYNPKTRQHIARCANPACTFRGTISRRTAEIRKAENAAEAAEAKHALANAVPWMKQDQKTEEQLLKDLGY